MDLEMEAKREAALQYQKNKEKKEQKPEEKKEEEPKIQFQIALTAGDFWQFSMHHSNGGMMGMFNLIFTAAALVLLIIRWGELTVPYRLLLVFCGSLFTVWQPLLLYNKAKKQAKRMAAQPPMALTFSRDGLLVEQGEQQVTFTWDQMGRMDRGRKLVVLYMDRIHAYLIPDRVMEDQQEAFFEMARTYLPKERRRRI